MLHPLMLNTKTMWGAYNSKMKEDAVQKNLLLL